MLIARGWAVLIFILALGARLWGIGWQLPEALYYDELKYVQWASSTAAGRQPATTDFRNPSLLRHLLTAEDRVADAIRGRQPPRDRAVFNLALARVTTALLGAAAVTLTALTVAALGSVSAAVVAGLVLALSPLHVHLSHIAVNDVAASAFLAGGMLAGVRALNAPSRGSVAIGGLLAGLAAATKYNFGVVVLLPLLGLLVQVIGKKLSSRQWLTLSTVLGAAFAIGLLVGMPELLTRPTAILEGIREQAQTGEDASEDQESIAVPLLYLETLVRSVGWVGLILALAGLPGLVTRRADVAVGLMGMSLVYLGVMLRGDLFAARFALPLALPVAVLAGLGASWSIRVSARWPELSRLLPGGLLLLGFTPLILDTVAHNRLTEERDTRVLAQDWLQQNARGAQVAAQNYSLPPVWDGGRGLDDVRVRRFQSLLNPDAVTRLQCDRVRYVLTASFNYESQLRNLPDPASETGYDRLAQVGEPVATYTPFKSGVSAPAHPDDTAIPFWYLHAYQRPGPRIEIYRLPDALPPACPPASRR